jgi:hypothetical protein
VTAPTLSGEAIVGQRLFGTSGTYSPVPDSVANSWYLGGVALADETGDSLLIIDTDAGSAITFGEIAHKSGLSDSALNLSAATGTIANIDLTDDAPALTRTTSSGVTPVHWDTVFGSKTFAEYKIQLQVASDVDFTTILQDIQKDLEEADLVAGATLDWTTNVTAPLTSIGATDYIRARIVTTTPLGTLKTSGWSAVISPTNFSHDAVTDNFDDNLLNAVLWVSGNNVPANLTINGATVAEASGTTLITPNPAGASAGGRRTVNAASFSGKFAAIRLPVDFDVTHQAAFLMVGPSGSQGYQLQIVGNGGGSSIHLYGLVSGVPTDLYGTGPFFGTYRWARIKHDGAGNILLQAAAGASVPGAWTTLTTFASGGWPYGNLGTGTHYVWIGGGSWAANAAITPVAIDDFNTDMAL